jgi:chromosome segregation ATPase
MPDAGPPTSKEQAETELIRAQIAKLEREGQPSPFSIRLVEVIKVVGSLILGLGGVTAAITGYQMSEIKNARLELEYAQKQAQLEGLNVQYERRRADYEKLSEDLKRLSLQLEGREKSVAEASASVERTHDQLLALRSELPSTSSRKLSEAIDDAAHAKSAIKVRDQDYERTKAEIKRLSIQQSALAAEDAQLNQRAAQTLRSMKAAAE